MLWIAEKDVYLQVKRNNHESASDFPQHDTDAV